MQVHVKSVFNISYITLLIFGNNHYKRHCQHLGIWHLMKRKTYVVLYAKQLRRFTSPAFLIQLRVRQSDEYYDKCIRIKHQERVINNKFNYLL